jgi:hypothetical protein
MKKSNQLQLITITNYDYPMSVSRGEGLAFSIQIRLILSKLHLNVIYKFIYGIEGHSVMVKGR